MARARGATHYRPRATISIIATETDSGSVECGPGSGSVRFAEERWRHTGTHWLRSGLRGYSFRCRHRRSIGIDRHRPPVKNLLHSSISTPILPFHLLAIVSRQIGNFKNYHTPFTARFHTKITNISTRFYFVNTSQFPFTRFFSRETYLPRKKIVGYDRATTTVVSQSRIII